MTEFETARRAMVASQIRTADVTSRELQDALLAIPRERFIPRSRQAKAYAETEAEISENRVMPRPRDFAKLAQAAGIAKGDIVLDIACGRGWSTAVLARLAETVVGLESEDRLVQRATERLAEIGADNAVVVKGELRTGAAGQGPFDVIFVNGAVDAVPQAWLDQLAENGRLAVFVRQGPVTRAMIYTRAGGASGGRTVFDANVSLLPGFETEPGFVF
jgi:protein-L-isoaspartate(D-aspartate) O-methyltransferase